MKKLNQKQKEQVELYLKRYAEQDIICSGEQYITNGPVWVVPAYNETELIKNVSSWKKVAKLSDSSISLFILLNAPENEKDELKDHYNYQKNELEKLFNENFKIKVFTRFFPDKNAGVGIARKFLMDLAVKEFFKSAIDGWIVNLDADCQVSKNYFQKVLKWDELQANVACIRYEHPIINEEDSIIDYELWLRYYQHALEYAGFHSPFPTVGSCMAARVSLYTKIGGMNKRKAAEDFYFLHKAFPVGDYFYERQACVYPSSRISNRVPFGTGRAQHEVTMGSNRYKHLYHFDIFRLLKILLKEAYAGRDYISENQRINSILKELEFNKHVKKCLTESNNEQVFKKKLDQTFNGFYILKLVHHLRDQFFGLQPQIQALRHLFTEINRDTTCKKPIEFLESLRE